MTNARKAVVRALLVTSATIFPIAAAQPAAAATAQRQSAAKISLNIPAQDLGSALSEFARQSNQQLLYSPELVKGKTSKAVFGSFSPEAGLRALLAGAGIGLSTASSGAFVLSGSPQGNALAGAPNAGSENNSTSSSGDADQSGKGISEILVVGKKSQNVDIRRTRDDIQPYVVIDRTNIERSGAANVEELLRSRLTMNYGQAANSQVGSSLTGSSSEIALRGLSSSQTLVLIDGRRVSNTVGVAGQEVQPDLNNIPIGSIERIETLPATASGIYGGSATGGVVNVILRHDYHGLEPSVTYENSFAGGGKRLQFGLNGGISTKDGKTSLLFSGSITENSPLRVGDREFIQKYVRRSDANSRANNTSYFSNPPPLGSVPNVAASTFYDINCYLQATGPGGLTPAEAAALCFVPPNLTLDAAFGGGSLASPITYLPFGFVNAQISGTAGLVQNAGLYDLMLPDTAQFSGRRANIINNPSLWSMEGTVRHEFSPGFEVFVSPSYRETRSEFRQSVVTSTFTVSGSAPNNPFQEDINVTIPVHLAGDDEYRTWAKRYGLVAGLKFPMFEDWKGALEYSIQLSKSRQEQPSSLNPQAQIDILTGAFDILTTPPVGGFDLSSYAMPGGTLEPASTKIQNASFRFGGRLMNLPAGSVNLTGLLEARRQDFGRTVTGIPTATGTLFFPFTAQWSKSKSAYVEVLAPLVSPDMKVPLLRRVELQLAGRYDSYVNRGGRAIFSPADELLSVDKEKFNSFNPTIGLRLQPAEVLTLRASYGTGYFPPPLRFAAQNPPIPTFLPFTDPKRGDSTIGSILYYSGGSADLRPENSSTWSAGFILKPTASLRLSADWTKIRKKNNISQLGIAQSTIDQEGELPEGIIIRNSDPSTFFPYSVGPIIGVNGGFINIYRDKSESVDVSFDYSVTTRNMGSFELSAIGTRLIHNLQQFAPATPPEEKSGTLASPKWQANASLTWNYGRLGVTWFTQYLDGVWLRSDHSFVDVQNSARLSSQLLHDIAAEYRFPSTGKAPLSAIVARAGIKNVFNTKPRFLGGGLGYDFYGRPMLASYYLSLSSSF